MRRYTVGQCNQFRISFLAFCCVAVMYTDRAVIANAIIPIGAELHGGDYHRSLVFSAFAWGYVVGMPLAGILGRFYSPRMVIGGASLLWALALLGTAAAVNYSQLICFRVLLGLFEAPVFPCLARLVAEHIRTGHRTKATAFFDSGSYIGPMIGGPSFVFLAHHARWRVALASLSLITFVFGLLWWAIVPRAGDITGPAVVGSHVSGYLQVLRDRRIVLVSVGFFAYNFAKSLFFTWLPFMIVSDWGRTQHFAASVNTLCFASGLVATAVSAIFLDTVVVTCLRPLLTRARTAGVGLALGAALILVPVTPLVAAKVALIAVAAGGVISASGAIWTIPAEVAHRPAMVPVIGAAQNSIANLANILAPLVVGLLRGYAEGSGPTFVVVGAVSLLGAASFFSVRGQH